MTDDDRPRAVGEADKECGGLPAVLDMDMDRRADVEYVGDRTSAERLNDAVRLIVSVIDMLGLVLLRVFCLYRVADAEGSGVGVTTVELFCTLPAVFVIDEDLVPDRSPTVGVAEIERASLDRELEMDSVLVGDPLVPVKYPTVGDWVKECGAVAMLRLIDRGDLVIEWTCDGLVDIDLGRLAALWVSE